MNKNIYVVENGKNTVAVCKFSNVNITLKNLSTRIQNLCYTYSDTVLIK